MDNGFTLSNILWKSFLLSLYPSLQTKYRHPSLPNDTGILLCQKWHGYPPLNDATSSGLGFRSPASTDLSWHMSPFLHLKPFCQEPLLLLLDWSSNQWSPTDVNYCTAAGTLLKCKLLDKQLQTDSLVGIAGAEVELCNTPLEVGEVSFNRFKEWE